MPGALRKGLDALYDGAAVLAALFMIGLLVMVLLSILGRQLQLDEQAIAERLRQVVLELLDLRLVANQRQQLAPSLTEETLGGLRRCFEVPLQVCQSMPLDLILARQLDLATRNV